jgi:serine phosphatase RsbU (regulator of sigma subunit)
MAEGVPFASRYRIALSAHVTARDETGRSEAYQLGRQAVAAGMSLLDLTVVHEEALEAVATPGNPAARAAATEFYLEALSTFDMAQRGYLEAQERARAERGHAERLTRLNRAVVAVASVPGYADRMEVVVDHVRSLFGDSARSALLIDDDAELVRPPSGPAVLNDLRLAATKARLNERTRVETAEWRGAGEGWLLATPIADPGQVPHGALLVWRADAFHDEDLAIAEQFSRYVSLAMAMAARFEQEHELAITLQHALLPPSPPSVPGIQVAWRYLPAEARDIGGDWYDVFNVDNGEVVLVVGDVMGHDLRAAAIMGQLRLALQAYAIDGYSPAEVMDRADRLLQRLDPGRLATLSYAVVDKSRRRLMLSNAGHPAPLLLGPDGSISQMSGGLSVPLGTDDPAARHRQVPYDLRPGTRLLFYTDGLVEDRRRAFDDGLAHLIQSLRCASGAPEDICERALSVRGEARDDDVCVLCAVIDPD